MVLPLRMPIRSLLVAWIVGSTCRGGWVRTETNALKTPFATPPVSMVVVFGRPGAGKTTVAESALAKVHRAAEAAESGNNAKKQKTVVGCTGLDLDACVTQEMRDDFGKGIYPTLAERKVFAERACQYVDERLPGVSSADELLPPNAVRVAIVSFSFVNSDLREIFRNRFPTAEWILIDTAERECAKRIEEREGHFYKGKPSRPREIDETKDDDDEDGNGKDGGAVDADNSDWEFEPVDFPHTILDGLDSPEDNAKKIVDKIILESTPPPEPE